MLPHMLKSRETRHKTSGMRLKEAKSPGSHIGSKLKRPWSHNPLQLDLEEVLCMVMVGQLFSWGKRVLRVLSNTGKQKTVTSSAYTQWMERQRRFWRKNKIAKMPKIEVAKKEYKSQFVMQFYNNANVYTPIFFKTWLTKGWFYKVASVFINYWKMPKI